MPLNLSEPTFQSSHIEWQNPDKLFSPEYGIRMYFEPNTKHVTCDRVSRNVFYKILGYLAEKISQLGNGSACQFFAQYINCGVEQLNNNSIENRDTCEFTWQDQESNLPWTKSIITKVREFLDNHPHVLDTPPSDDAALNFTSLDELVNEIQPNPLPNQMLEEQPDLDAQIPQAAYFNSSQISDPAPSDPSSSDPSSSDPSSWEQPNPGTGISQPVDHSGLQIELKPITLGLKITPSTIPFYQVPEEVRIALDEIFAPPLPPFESNDFISEIAKRGVTFIKLGGDCNIGFLKNLNYIVKIQRDDTALKEGHQDNLSRILINEKIKQCIKENNFKQITYIDKYIYPLPSATTDQAVNDTNAIVVTPQVTTYVVNLQELTDEEYDELVKMIAIVGYADLRGANFTWIVGDGGEAKLAFIDTEDIAAKSIASDRMLRMFCQSRFDIDCRWHRNKKSIEIANFAQSLLDEHPEVARQIIHQLQVYHRGLRPLKPTHNEINREEVFARAKSIIEEEIQRLLASVNISFKVELN